MNNRTSPLSARVTARNRANKIANKLHPLLCAEVAKLLANGKQLSKADGDLTAIARKALDPIIAACKENNSQIWISRNYSSFSFNVKTWENLLGLAYYTEAYGYIAENDNVNGGMKVCEAFSDRRTDYKAEEIANARKAVEVAEKALREAEGKLCGFDRYDR